MAAAEAQETIIDVRAPQVHGIRAIGGLADLAVALADATSESELHEVVADRLATVLAVERTSITRHGATGDLEVIAIGGHDMDLPVGTSIGGAGSTPSTAEEAGMLIQADLAQTNPLSHLAQSGIRFVMCTPLVVDDAQIGTLNVGRASGRFSDEEQTVIQAVSTLLAANLERVTVTNRLHHTAMSARAEADALTMLHDLAAELAQSMDRTDAITAVGRHLPAVMPADRVSYCELASDQSVFHIWGAHGDTNKVWQRGELTTGNSCPGMVLRSGCALNTPDLAETDVDERDLLLALGLRSALSVPVMIDDQPKGTINVASAALDAFGPEDETVLQVVARLLGATIGRILLHQEAQRTLQQSEQRLRDIIDLVPNQIFAKDEASRYVLVNKALADAYGMEVDEVVGRTERELRGDCVEVRTSMMQDRRVIATGETVEINDSIMAHADGRLVVSHVTKMPFDVTGQGTPGVLGVAVDVTAFRDTEEALARSSRHVRALYDDNPTTLVTVDSDGRILSTNQFGAEQLGYQVVELVGQPFWLQHHDEDRAQVRTQVADALVDHVDQVRRWEARMQRKDGSIVWTRQSVRSVHRSDGSNLLFVVCEDVSDVKVLAERLRHQATHDSLTSLVNRSEFERELRRALADTASGERHVLCFMDLDHFKVVNDASGHSAGDRVLRQLGGLLSDLVPSHAVLARFGGDEFVLLLEGHSAAEALPIVEQIREAIEGADLRWGNRPFHVTASIGIVELDEHTRHPADAMSAADSACFAAKDKGRNRIEVWAPSVDRLTNRRVELAWPGRMREALDTDRFVLVAQPLIALGRDATAEDRIEGFEILVRMRDPDGSLILPGAFLPAAERYNLATRLDHWVMDRAVTVLAEHAGAARRVHMWAINLSGHTLADDAFFTRAEHLVSSANLPPDRLCFELTESAAAEDMTKARRLISMLRGLGCRVALDDFGSGFSSLGYLRQLDVDLLKIFGSLVRAVVDDPVSAAMVRSVHEVARAMGLQTVAEYVETDLIRERVRAIGIDFGQGHALGVPEPLDEVLARLGDESTTSYRAAGASGRPDIITSLV